jgi:macrolide-specific efflux system membrane fusion protein
MLMPTELESPGAATAVRIRWPSRRLRAGLLGLALLAAGAGSAYRYWWAEPPPPVRTAPVVLGDVEKTVTALGSVKPKNYVDVGTQVSGQLRKVRVEVGDQVTKGQLLAEIDPTVYETRVRADRARAQDLKAQLAQQRAQLELARRQDARNRQLFAEGVISRDALEIGDAALRVAAGRVASLGAQIEEAEATLRGDLANLGYTRIYAPMSGTVVSQPAVEGQTLNANQTAPTILRVADLDTVTVWAQVSEADVVRLKPGLPAYFTTLGMPDRRWRGEVRQILPTPEVVNDVVLHNVLVDVSNPDRALTPDMTAQVFFVLGAARNVPVVPVEALTGSGDGAAAAYRVLVLSGKDVLLKPVEIGLVNRTAAEVVSGLSVGERVVTGTDADTGGDAGPRPSGSPSGSPRRGPLARPVL